MVRMVAEELKGRQADAQRRKRAGEQDPFQRPPLLLLLDEYATMLAEIKAEYGADTFESDLLFLTRVGREFKVHVGFASQEAYRDTLPGTLLGNIGLRVSLGPPADKTIKEVFPEKLRSDAIRIGGTISKNDRGRGLALMTDDEGTARAVEFQSYYGYSPAESKPAPNTEIASEWDRYKTQASDRVPTLYPRMWFAVDGPDYAADLDTLYGLEAVRLTSRDGTARPGTAIHDPLSDDYLGGVSAAGSVLEYLDELEEDQPDHLHTTRATPYPFDDAEADPVLDDEPPHLDLALTEDSPAAATAVAEPEPELATPVVVEPIPEPVPAPNRIPRRQQGV
ncbi:hypothetical protein GS531_23075 [Rhodococcus hoagii]|nr:hypothetical protein [Prescottella equi]